MATSLSKPQLPLSSALKIIEKCQERANLLGVKVTVAICDDGGHLIACCRQDNCIPLSVQIAESKAVGSALFGKDGEDLLSMHTSRPAFFNQVDKLGRLPLIPGLGGVVIRSRQDGGLIMGAIGVSGASPEQDAEIARFGIANGLI